MRKSSLGRESDVVCYFDFEVAACNYFMMLFGKDVIGFGIYWVSEMVVIVVVINFF